MLTSIASRNLTFSHPRTYVAATLFIIGNIILPQLVHTLHQGGPTWLPIYFFTLIGACLCGWRVGLLTALASPVVNSLLFGMPAVAMLPAIILKSTVLAMVAALAVRKAGRLSLALIVAIVACYQGIGTLGEWMLTGDFAVACQDFRLGFPGMLLQIFGGYAVVRFMEVRRLI